MSPAFVRTCRPSAAIAALFVLMLLALAAPPRAQATETGVVFGARSGSGGSVDHVASARELKAGWVRLFADWEALEPSRGHYSGHYAALIDTIRSAKAAGRKVLVVAVRAPRWASGADGGITPPKRASDYARFVRGLIARTGGTVDAWEIWNEADDAAWWKRPSARRYTRLLRVAYREIKRADPDATVVTAGLVGNDYRFVRNMYRAGARGSFDAIGVHTDTACLTAPPDFSYRERDGRLGRYAFTTYREVHREMRRYRDGHKRIWMTELGWMTTPGTCRTGMRAGKVAAGVSEEQQARFLTQAYRCLATDGLVDVGIWFSLQDVDPSIRYGLFGDGGNRKPSAAAFAALNGAPARLPQPCGLPVDETPPTVRVASPTPNHTFKGPLPIQASASDPQGIIGMELFVNGRKQSGRQKGGRFVLNWQGAKKLRRGKHRITLRAIDRAHNVGRTTIRVKKLRRG